jgi:pimeloyl-ACP methyl ester carboxylesterase
MNRAAPRTITVTSRDGTPIAVTVRGDGPPLLVVHGSLSSAGDWRSLAEVLANDLTVYTIDRRGRGASGDGADFSLQREQEDIEAVLDAIGTDTVVFGHSYGAFIALHVAAARPLSGLIVYEPAPPLDGPLFGSTVDPYQELVDSGDLDGALEYGMVQFVKFTPEQVDEFRGTPAWSTLAVLTPTWGRELAAIDSAEPGLDAYRGIAAPTMMLVGEVSPDWLVEASRRLNATVPQSRLVTLAGQAHDAHTFAPQALAEEIVRFVRDLGQPRTTDSIES